MDSTGACQFSMVKGPCRTQLLPRDRQCTVSSAPAAVLPKARSTNGSDILATVYWSAAAPSGRTVHLMSPRSGTQRTPVIAFPWPRTRQPTCLTPTSLAEGGDVDGLAPHASVPSGSVRYSSSMASN